MTEVLLDRHGGVAVITIDRPAVRNAIGPATMDALDDALDAAVQADVLVIRGSGDRAFVSGGDLKEPAKIRTHEDALAMAVRMRRQELAAGRAKPLQLWAVLDEAVLRREVGGRRVMRAQLHRLAEAGRQTNVTLQVLPFRMGAHIVALRRGV